MHKDVNEKVSMFVDDELNYEETQSLLKRIKADDSLKAIMARYQVVSHTLKTEEFQQLRPDFFDNISQQVSQEVTYLWPQKEAASPRKKLLAIAASTIAAAIIVGGTVKNYQTTSPNQAAITASTSPELMTPAASTPIVLAQQVKGTAPERKPMTKAFNDYLQAHNGSVYMNGGVGLQSYAKVAAYGRE